MTTVANKAGLRAAATARREKAAQRTPLPAKATIPPQRTPQPAKATLVAEPTPVARKTRAPKAKQQPVVAPAAATLSKKISKNVSHFEANGWTVEITQTGDRTEMIARRGPEVMSQVWIGESYDYTMATYAIGDQTVKPRNASAARQWAERAPAAAEARFAKVAENRQFRRRPTALTPTRGLPFTLDAPDHVIIAALVGQRVAWHNRYREVEETATVGPDPRRVQIKDGPDGERIVQFCCKTTGFRAFRLTGLRRVGRARVAAGQLAKAA